MFQTIAVSAPPQEQITLQNDIETLSKSFRPPLSNFQMSPIDRPSNALSFVLVCTILTFFPTYDSHDNKVHRWLDPNHQGSC